MSTSTFTRVTLMVLAWPDRLNVGQIAKWRTMQSTPEKPLKIPAHGLYAAREVPNTVH